MEDIEKQKDDLGRELSAVRSEKISCEQDLYSKVSFKYFCIIKHLVN